MKNIFIKKNVLKDSALKEFSLKSKALTTVVLTAAMLIVPASFAFELSGNRWKTGTTTMHIAIPGSSAGKFYKDAVQAAMLEWNQTSFRFEIDDSYLDPCVGYSRSSNGKDFPKGNGNSLNSMDFRADVCGNDFGSGVLAITLNTSASNPIGFRYLAEADIIFNSAYNWSIYSGPRQQSQVDFGRVALHELGHVLGLSHEKAANAIMSDKISDLDALTIDDIAGAERLYGAPTTCAITNLPLNVLVRDSLAEGDCHMHELYSTGNDISFVDTYRISLTETTTLQLKMNSAELDSVLLLTDLLLNPKSEVLDDSNGSCNVNESITLSAGDYLLLANTYANPEKCAGNTGSYVLTVSDSPFPLLGNTGNTNVNAILSNSIFTGSARLDAGAEPQSTFSATDKISVDARINVDPAHVGQPGKIFILAALSNGKQFMKNAAGQFPQYKGNLATLQAAFSGNLKAVEDISVIKSFKGSTTGLSGQDFNIYVGYSLDTAPQDIHFGGKPIAFTIEKK